jgi:signal transduction histidine kinase
MPSYFTLFAAALLLAFAGMVWRVSPRRPINRWFTAFAVSIACWAIGVGAAHTGYYMDFWTAVAFASSGFITPSFFAFIAAHAPADRWSSPRLIRASFAVAILFAVMSLTTRFVFYDAHLTVDGIQRRPGGLYNLFAAFILLSWGGAFLLFISKWLRAHGRARARLQYLIAGMVLPGVAVIATNLLWPLFTGRSTLSWLGPWAGLIFAAIVGHGIIRRRLPDLRFVVHRSLTLATAIALSAVPAAILVAVFWPRLLTALNPIELGLVLISTAIVTVVTPIVRDAANRLLNRYLYRTQTNYRQTVLEASQMLTRVLVLKKLLAFIGTTVMRSTGAEGAAIYLLEANSFRCVFAEKRRGVEDFHAPRELPVEAIEALRAVREPILTDEIARESDATAAQLHDRIIQNNWFLLLPVVSDDTLIATIAVGSKLSGDPFYPQDLDLLMTLANQAGIAVKNAQLYAAVVLANEYLENIVATIESGVIAIDAEGTIAMFNRAAEHLTMLEAAATKSIDALPACLAEPLMSTVADGQPRTQPEIELPSAVLVEDGPASRPVICTVSPVRDPTGAVLGAVAVFSDLTPLKELEVERRRAERLAYFQALAAGIAHEIKNPLVAIKTFAQLLPRRPGDTRFLEEFGRIATREIDRMQHLVDRLRTLSRPASGPRHGIDVRLPLTEALELVQPTLEEKGLTMTAGLGTESCVVSGNHLELRELFLNLVLNAHDATPAGGAVEVELARSETHVIVTVADSGMGIAPELLERVFEPFFTTKARGSGLGLAISAGIAQAHGARLRAHNRAGGGAVFTVEFASATVTPVVVS